MHILYLNFLCKQITIRYNFTPTPEEIEETISKMGGDLRILEKDFVKTVECFDDSKGLPDMNIVPMPSPIFNPQTINFCCKLGIDDPLQKITTSSSWSSSSSPSSSSFITVGPFNQSEMNVTQISPDKASTTNLLNMSSNPEKVSKICMQNTA